MKINLKDIRLNWNVYPNIPQFLENDFDLMSNVTFNVKIFDENLNLITEKKNIPSSKIDKAESFNAHFSLSRTFGIVTEPIPLEYMVMSPKKILDTNYFNQNVKKVIPETFLYSFEENANDFFLKNKSYGFYKKLKIVIDYNLMENTQSIEVEYNPIDMKSLSVDKIFTKIFKSEDDVSLKFKINFDEFKNSGVKSLFIIPYIYENNAKTKLSEIFISNIENKWLNNSDNTKLLTVPFEDNFSIVHDILSVDLILLNDVQTEILEYFKNKLPKDNFSNLTKDFFGDQFYASNLIYSENLLNKIAGFYQGYLYLFNNESWKNISWPENKESILNLEYLKYFPLAKKENIETISLEKEMEIESSVLEINENNIQKNYLGYKIDGSFKDIKDDSIYFKSSNIQSVSILNVEEFLNKSKIYIEFITNFDLLSNIYIDSTSNNLSFIQKYYKNINDKNYVALLFCYEYENYLTSEEVKLNCIQGKKLINFNIRLY